MRTVTGCPVFSETQRITIWTETTLRQLTKPVNNPSASTQPEVNRPRLSVIKVWLIAGRPHVTAAKERVRFRYVTQNTGCGHGKLRLQRNELQGLMCYFIAHCNVLSDEDDLDNCAVRLCFTTRIFTFSNSIFYIYSWSSSINSLLFLSYDIARGTLTGVKRISIIYFYFLKKQTKLGLRIYKRINTIRL